MSSRQNEGLSFESSVNFTPKNLQVCIAFFDRSAENDSNGQPIFAFLSSCQVISFDTKWREIYIGSVSNNDFVCTSPSEDVPADARSFTASFPARQGRDDGPAVTCAKWCPMESTTILVLGKSQLAAGLQEHRIGVLNDT